MGFPIQLSIESKIFSLIRVGILHITERSRRLVKDISLGMSTVFWLAKALEACSKGESRDFYVAHQGVRGFIA